MDLYSATLMKVLIISKGFVSLFVFETGSFYNIGWPRALCVIQADVNIFILLPWFPWCIGMYRYAQPRIF